jgi:hypothetical protein
MRFAVARFSISKDDLYIIQEIETFPDLKSAEDFYRTHGYGEMAGGTRQERWEYHVVEVRDGRYRWPGGARIRTVLDP